MTTTMTHTTTQAARTDDAGIEQMIQARGLTAPRVTPADIEAVIASEHYFTAGEGVIGAFVAAEQAKGEPGICPNTVHDFKASLNLLTFCVLTLRNGFTVTGESACASPENFDAEIGRKIARENAKNKLWPLLGYQLKERLAAQSEARAGEHPAAAPASAATIDGTAVGLSFGEALEVLKAGGKVCRAGWNGKGMWLALVRPDDDLNPPEKPAYTVSGLVDQVGPCLPWIGMRTADNRFVPWLASQTDMLAEDWQAMDVEVPAA